MINPLPYIKKANDHGYAVPHFNIHNLDNMRAAVESAKKLGSPVILAATPKTIAFSGLKCLIGIANSLEEIHNIPVALHLDHHTDVDSIMEGIDLGVKSVMIDASKHDFEKNVEMTKKIVNYAKGKDVCVEAEIGIIGGVEDNINVADEDARYSIPEDVVKFARLTGVDLVAPSFGTAHGIYKKKPVLKTEILTQIKKLDPSILLVLHGGSGLTDEQFIESIQKGVSKVNIGTELKKPMVDGIRGFWEKKPNEYDPRFYVQAGVDSLKKVIEQKINLLGSSFTV